MTQWNLVIPEETDVSVRNFLARAVGEKADLSAYVDHAVRQSLFWDTVERIQDRNKDLSPEDAQSLADEAVTEIRANPT